MAFSFFDQGGSLIGASIVTTLPEDGSLNFLGFSSTEGIRSVSVTGDYLVADDFQANPVAAPAVPGPLAALPFALMALRRRKRV